MLFYNIFIKNFKAIDNKIKRIKINDFELKIEYNKLNWDLEKEVKCMEKEVIGTVISVKRQWWLKVNTKTIRMHALDGATFPYIIKVKYTVNGKDYIKKKWIGPGYPVPNVGSSLMVTYCVEKPTKAKIL